MAVCPNGHDSASEDFCEVCGFNFTTPGSFASPPSYAPPSSTSPPFPGLQVAPTASAPGAEAHVTWTAVVAADRAYYDQVRAASGSEGEAIGFPAYYAERRFRLAGTQMRIGRRSVSRGLEPEIDLTGPPVDPGISRLHAVLIAVLDSGWAVLDPGSANGTLVNGTEVRVGDQVPLHDGDRINLGAWTAITVYRG
jgi:FHA domain